MVMSALKGEKVTCHKPRFHDFFTVYLLLVQVHTTYRVVAQLMRERCQRGEKIILDFGDPSELYSVLYSSAE